MLSETRVLEKCFGHWQQAVTVQWFNLMHTDIWKEIKDKDTCEQQLNKYKKNKESKKNYQSSLKKLED